jgi:general secretion pathway protein N
MADRHILLAGVFLLALVASDGLSASPGVAAALEGDAHDIDRPAGGPANDADFGAVESPFLNIPLESLSATRERPLFSATRRPPSPSGATPIETPPPAQAPAPVASEPNGPPLALIGTITGADRPVAVLFNKLTRSVSTAHEGDETLGWRIATVSSRSATAEKDGVTVTLNLPRPDDPGTSRR